MKKIAVASLMILMAMSILAQTKVTWITTSQREQWKRCLLIIDY